MNLAEFGSGEQRDATRFDCSIPHSLKRDALKAQREEDGCCDDAEEQHKAVSGPIN